jgi:hypothetical protein
MCPPPPLSLPKPPHAPRNRQSHHDHVHPKSQQNALQIKRPTHMQRRQWQHDVTHRQLHRHPKKQPAHHPMFRHKPQPPANPIKNPRRRTSYKVVQHQPKQIDSRASILDYSWPQQPRRNYLRNLRSKQDACLQNIQSPRHEPCNPNRRQRIPSSSRPIPRTHAHASPFRSPPCSRGRLSDRGLFCSGTTQRAAHYPRRKGKVLTHP